MTAEIRNSRGATVTVIFVLLLSSMPARMTAQPKYSQPGKMVDAGGYRIHLNCMGETQPAVVIVGAGYSFDWALVQPEVAKFARVCTYDPSGSVWSDPGPAPTCAGRIQEIHTMLHNARVAGPFIVVGHSMGAVFGRMYASSYPADVAGMVLVDHAGRYRVTNGVMPSGQESLLKLPFPAQELHRWADSLPSARGGGSSTPFLNSCLAELGSGTAGTSGSFGNKPLIIIANSVMAGSEDYRRTESTLLALSHNSKAMVAPHSGHAVPMDNPGVIVEAIRQVVAAARSHASLQSQ